MPAFRVKKSGEKKLWAITALWLVLTSAALLVMAEYGSQQGQSAKAPMLWPDDLQYMIQPVPAKPTLVMFAHPLCPCTRASFWELASISNRLYGLVSVDVLFYEPEDTSSNPALWVASDLEKIASRFPHTQMHVDVEGRIAGNFGAYTSGQILLYDTDGRLQFAGGITPSRGHTGTNPGSAAVVTAIISDKGVDPLAPRVNPVFGCSLHGEADDDRKINPYSYN